jgi:hypothetical protein
MEGKTIKTLAEYIAKLQRDHVALEHPELYNHNESDTNGIEQDHVDVKDSLKS